MVATASRSATRTAVVRAIVAGRVRTRPLRADLSDLAGRLAAMDAAGMDVQVLSSWIDLTAYALPAGNGARYARMFNEALVATAAEAPGRFETLCTVPLQDPVAAAVELRHAVTSLGMVGVEIATRVDGRELDDPDLEPFWTAAEELRVRRPRPPLRLPGRPGRVPLLLGNLVGNPAESTIAAAHLIFGGVLERHPDLRVCLVHGGGFAPYQMGRWDHAFGRNAEAPPPTSPGRRASGSRTCATTPCCTRRTRCASSSTLSGRIMSSSAATTPSRWVTSTRWRRCVRSPA